MHFSLHFTSSFVTFKKSSVLNLWTRTILGIIIKEKMKEKMKDTIVDGVCSDEDKDKKENSEKKPRKNDFKDSGINYWGDFINPFTPGYNSYKPWIY